MKPNPIPMIIILFLFIGCDDQIAPDISDDPDNGDKKEMEEVEIITISGTVLNQEIAAINRVGLFRADDGLAAYNINIKEDDSSPLISAEISNNQWSLTFSDSLKAERMAVVGWNDLDGDGRLDPISGENFGFGHTSEDSLAIEYIFHIENDSYNGFAGTDSIDSWGVDNVNRLDNLDNHLIDWFIIDDSKSDLIDKWSFSSFSGDTVFNFVSGLAIGRGLEIISGVELPEALTIILYNVERTCLDVHFGLLSGRLGLVSVAYPEISSRYYDKNEAAFTRAFGFYGKETLNSNLHGITPRAGLSSVDVTDEKRVKGWIAIRDDNNTGVYGTFDVPFCSATLDSVYFPTEPIESWAFRDSVYQVGSGFSQTVCGRDDLLVIFSPLDSLNCPGCPYDQPQAPYIQIIIPDPEIRLYSGSELRYFHSGPGGYGFNAAAGVAAITSIDSLVDMRVMGWLSLKEADLRFEVFGTFDVPYCSGS